MAGMSFLSLIATGMTCPYIYMVVPDVTQQELAVHPDCLHTMHQQHVCLVFITAGVDQHLVDQ